MMIFRQIAEIESGQKTQTRRVVKPNEWAEVDDQARDCILAVRTDDRIKHRVDKTYSMVPKRGAAGVGHIRITFIDRERLHNISEEDARAEGVNSVEEYRQLWESINTAPGVRWEDNPLVWVYHFTYCVPTPIPF